jgi:hypothetical protein
MRRIRRLIMIAALACCGASAAFATQAQAVQWTGSGYHLESGQNGFLNHTVKLEVSTGLGSNRAVCAGIRGYLEECAPRGSAASADLEKVVSSEPYLHNHDSEGGYFEGWYYE